MTINFHAARRRLLFMPFIVIRRHITPLITWIIFWEYRKASIFYSRFPLQYCNTALNIQCIWSNIRILAKGFARYDVLAIDMWLTDRSTPWGLAQVAQAVSVCVYVCMYHTRVYVHVRRMCVREGVCMYNPAWVTTSVILRSRSVIKSPSRRHDKRKCDWSPPGVSMSDSAAFASKQGKLTAPPA